jgi:hypothetical protein
MTIGYITDLDFSCAHAGATMNFDDADSEPLKEWMIKKLGNM